MDNSNKNIARGFMVLGIFLLSLALIRLSWMIASGEAPFFFIIFSFIGNSPYGLAFLIGGKLWLRNIKKKEKLWKKQRFVDTVNMIMRLAKRFNGELTVLSLNSHTRLSLEDSKKFLEYLHGQGHIELRVTDNGAIIYEFPDFLPFGQKENRLNPPLY